MTGFIGICISVWLVLFWIWFSQQEKVVFFLHYFLCVPVAVCFAFFGNSDPMVIATAQAYLTLSLIGKVAFKSS